MGHEVALVDAFDSSVEGFFHYFVLVEETEFLNDGTAESVNLVTGVHPPYSTAAKLLLQALAQMGGEDVALDERVAEIRNTDGTSKGAALVEHTVEMIHTARLTLAVVVDEGDTLGPIFLNMAGLFLKRGVSDNHLSGLRRRRTRDDVDGVLLPIHFRKNVAQDIDGTQFGAGNRDGGQQVQGQHHDNDQPYQHESACRLIHGRIAAKNWSSLVIPLAVQKPRRVTKSILKNSSSKEY